jgi:hypothetical protein
MADINKREVKRNGRGQIVSYEIEGVFDSTNNSLQYGDVEIGVDNVMVTKYIESSFNANVDINIAELQDPNLANYKIPNPSIVMGAQLQPPPPSPYDIGDVTNQEASTIADTTGEINVDLFNPGSFYDMVSFGNYEDFQNGITNSEDIYLPEGP